LIYLYGYLVIGVASLIVILITHLASRQRESEFVRGMKDAFHPERKTWRYRILNDFVVIPLAALAVVIVWPIAFYMKGKDIWGEKETPLTDFKEAKKEFAVAQADLVETLSMQEIESRESISDPMGGVPEAPFGHLNVAWLKFKAQLEPTDYLSSFSARWENSWGEEDILTGYVIVCGSHLGAHFLTERRRLKPEGADK
jgi:hypothetical protein